MSEQKMGDAPGGLTAAEDSPAAVKNNLVDDHEEWDASQFNGAQKDHPLALSQPGGHLSFGLRERVGYNSRSRATRTVGEPAGEPPC
jgi:hypothetical protein